MSFPRTRRFLGLFSRPVGWQDRGRMERMYRSGGLLEVTRVHAYCNTPLRIGAQDGTPFHYCPRCLVKTAPAYHDDAGERVGQGQAIQSRAGSGP